MPQTLTYTVINAQIVPLERQMEVEGQPAKVTIERAVIEAAPTDLGGKTLTLALPADALAEFPEGSEIIVTVSAKQEG